MSTAGYKRTARGRRSWTSRASGTARQRHELRTPRGALQDDNAHNWSASYPSVNFDDGLVAGVRKGGVLTRKLDSAVYEIVRVVPNGFGRTTLQLSKRKRAH
ncbi:hypothetical protein ABIF20_003877 [Bradyrhizobium japonicum]